MHDWLPGPDQLNGKLLRHFITVLVFAVLVIAAAEAFPQAALASAQAPAGIPLR